jgi:predicted nucleic acid-binding protein
MAMSFLIDTNIFLEILLDQDKKEICKQFLAQNIDQISISDFSLHSIGVILFRYRAEDLFADFISDIVPNMTVLSCSAGQLSAVIQARKKLDLDFDDAYQYALARKHGLKVVTMDKDFRAAPETEVVFL